MEQDPTVVSPPSVWKIIWHTVGIFVCVYFWKNRGREGISIFSFSLKKLPKAFLEHIEYLRI